MTKDFFVTQMDRLMRTYGEKAYPKERMDAIWDRVKSAPGPQFEKALTHLIGEQFTPPAVSKIAEAMGRLPMQAGSSVQGYVQTSPYECEPCRDFGYGWIGETIVRCVCKLGEKVSDAEIARQQKNYEVGKEIFARAKAVVEGRASGRIPMPSLTKPLPYDPKKRIG